MEELINEWKSNSLSEKESNKTFLKTLQTKPKDEVFQALKSIHNDTFKQIDCLSCGNCCRTTPALIISSDIKRIAKHLNLSPKQFIKKYILEDVNGEMTLNGVPCSFLNQDNTCAIYDIRPEACRRYPHTDEVGFERRVALNVMNTIVCPAAYHITKRLANIFPTELPI